MPMKQNGLFSNFPPNPCGSCFPPLWTPSMCAAVLATQNRLGQSAGVRQHKAQSRVALVSRAARSGSVHGQEKAKVQSCQTHHFAFHEAGHHVPAQRHESDIVPDQLDGRVWQPRKPGLGREDGQAASPCVDIHYHQCPQRGALQQGQLTPH